MLVGPLALADDVNMDDFNIDLGDDALGGPGGANTVTYSGGHSERKGEVGSNIPITVSHLGGPITVPLQAKLTITGGDGPITVSNCVGTIKASNTKGDINIQGSFTSFSVSAPSGDVSLDMGPDSKVSTASSISAPKGNVRLKMPRSTNNNLDASGSEVMVDFLVTGTNTATRVAGQLGSGGPAIKVSAPKGTVTVGIND